MTSYERDQYVTSTIWYGHLSKNNGSITGRPGIARSSILRSVRMRTNVQEKQSGIAEERQSPRFP